MTISWYPGHMAKAKRQLGEQLSRVDVVIEVCDARIPISSRNPDLFKMIAHKKHLILLNKVDLANSRETEKWRKHYAEQGTIALPLSANVKKSVAQVTAAVDELTQDSVNRAAERGMRRTVRAMVIGVPNVGKSTLINSLSKRSTLKTEDRPGVTRANQWVKVTPYFELMDTPGLLWPKLGDPVAARRLAYVSAIRDQVIDVYDLSLYLLEDLMQLVPNDVCTRFKVEDSSLRGQALLEAICKGRGFLLSGGAYDLERGVQTLLNEYRDGRIARLTLEKAPEEAL